MDVTVVDRQAHHLFQPLLYQVATDVLERRVVECSLLDRTWELSYDSLIVAAGFRQSYFGHDEVGIHAPGMKTIDDPLEVRGRIFGAFELAELEDDSPRRA